MSSHDAQAIVQHLANMHENVSPIGLLLQECSNILSLCSQFTIAFVKGKLIELVITWLNYNICMLFHVESLTEIVGAFFYKIFP